MANIAIITPNISGPEIVSPNETETETEVETSDTLGYDIFADINSAGHVRGVEDEVGEFEFSFAKLTPTKDEAELTLDFPEIKPEIVLKKKTTRRQSGPKRRQFSCSECGLEMAYSMLDGSPCYVCDECGAIEEVIGDNSELPEGGSIHSSCATVNNYNTSSTSGTPLRMLGPENRTYQRRLVSSTSVYKNTQRKNTLDDMVKAAHKYEGPGVSKDIIDEAAAQYYQLQQHYIKRGEVRKGIMAHLVYDLCGQRGIHRKPKEIADMFETTQSELSNGAKIIADAKAEGIIKSSSPKFGFDITSTMESLLGRYFEIFGIPTDDGSGNGFGYKPHSNYKDFSTTLIRFTIKKRISRSSIMSSRCAGVIYILSIKCPELDIKREDIVKECAISKSTFVRFANPILKMIASTDDKVTETKTYKQLKHIFKKSRI